MYVPPVWLGATTPAEPTMATVPVRTSMVPPRLLKRWPNPPIVVTPVPADLRRVPALLKTPFVTSASPWKSYRPPARLLIVPSGPDKKKAKAAELQISGARVRDGPSVVEQATQELDVAPGQSNRAGVGEPYRAAGDDAARPLEQPGWEVEGGPGRADLQHAGADADGPGPRTSVGAAVADGSVPCWSGPARLRWPR